MNDTITRLQAYQAAGADVLYAPGLTTKDDIAAVVRSVDRPVNVVMGLQGVQSCLRPSPLHTVDVKVRVEKRQSASLRRACDCFLPRPDRNRLSLIEGGALSLVPEVDRRARVVSVDALRGLVMIIMALDHTRDYFHAGAMAFLPEDLARTTVLLFFTRWVTHICAPVFMFAAGIGAFLWMRRGRTTGELSRFLWKRGFWLVVLEVTVLRLAMNFSLFSGPVVLTVLWALGFSMIALGFLVRLPVRALASLSLLMIALHNLTDSISASQLFGSVAWIWNILHQPGMIRAGEMVILVGYPLVPWVAVMAAGFCFGHLIVMEGPPRRRQWLIRIGLGLTVAFFVIRGVNDYGDPSPWSWQVPGMTILSFLKCTKYPPSLDFLLMTLGPAILLLAWMGAARFSKNNPLLVFGRVPLFYFLVHISVVHGLTIPFALVRYGKAGFLFSPLPSLGGSPQLYPPDYGFPLWVVYLVWLLVVLLMYPLCVWFARLKERREDWWLSYL